MLLVHEIRLAYGRVADKQGGNLTMRVLILGGDGYLGWPTAMHFADAGDEVMVVDNYLRRNIARETSSEALIEAKNLGRRCQIYEEGTGQHIRCEIADCNDYNRLSAIFADFRPDTVVHYAEQPS
ncbi:MAG: NAD-dependent epimerase/dehydratase family protein, partial [Hoeflea sp.]